MKVLILAGGYGTRLSELTEVIPKPMVLVGERPLIWHIMKRFSLYGVNDFVVALGYKGDSIKDYFVNYATRSGDLEVDLKSGLVTRGAYADEGWRVSLIDTGVDTSTAGRLLKCLPHLGGRFFLTYGDGVANVDIDALLLRHTQSEKALTISAVRPPARFGEIEIDASSNLKAFDEKPQLNQGWINGGFWIVESGFSKFLTSADEMLEREPMSRAVRAGAVAVYKHEGYWQCVDTLRDLQLLRGQLKRDPLWLRR